MNATELRATLSLAGIFALRMLGLFMVLPVMALYAQHLPGYTPSLLGIALGSYGLTQALLQIPFGVLSDFYSRKLIIGIGFGILALGSIIAAASHTMWGLILGRTLQGAGAVGSATLALVADLTRPEQRTKAMAIIGITIGTSFSLALVLGPIFSHWLDVPGLFWLTLGLSLLGILILRFGVPNPTNHSAQTIPQDRLVKRLKAVLMNTDLLHLDLGIFILHAVMTANFVALPFVLQNYLQISPGQHWTLYLPALLLACITIMPLLRKARQTKHMLKITLMSISCLILAEISMILSSHHVYALIGSLWLFFCAFTLLEACLPALISQLAPAESKGTAIGIFSSAQFFGIFFGGACGGWLYGHHAINGVFFFCIAISTFWLMLTYRFKQNLISS